MAEQHSPAAPAATTHAVFIDGDWLEAVRRAHIRCDYEQLVTFVKATFGPAAAIHMYLSTIQRHPITGRSASGTSKRVERSVPSDRFAALGIRLHAIPASPGKGSDIDMSLAVDAMALAPEIRTFALLSGDSDFVPLLTRMRQAGRRTVLISFPLALSKILRNAADEFINLESIVAGQGPGARISSIPPDIGYSLQSQVIYDKGERLKSYIDFRSLLTKAQRDIIIVDPYIGIELFETFACLLNKVTITVLTNAQKVPKDLGVLVKRCRENGLRLRVFTSTDIHDRYLMSDDELWHSGHSFKDIGSRVSQMSPVGGANRDKLVQILERTLASAPELHA